MAGGEKFMFNLLILCNFHSTNSSRVLIFPQQERKGLEQKSSRFMWETKVRRACLCNTDVLAPFHMRTPSHSHLLTVVSTCLPNVSSSESSNTSRACHPTPLQTVQRSSLESQLFQETGCCVVKGIPPQIQSHLLCPCPAPALPLPHQWFWSQFLNS